jgi:hypothetical protein
MKSVTKLRSRSVERRRQRVRTVREFVSYPPASEDPLNRGVEHEQYRGSINSRHDQGAGAGFRHFSIRPASRTYSHRTSMLSDEKLARSLLKNAA